MANPELPKVPERFDARLSAFEADCICVFIDEIYAGFGCFVGKLDDDAPIRLF